MTACSTLVMQHYKSFVPQMSLATPLLPSDSDSDVILTINDDSNPRGDARPDCADDNPYGFLGLHRLEIPGPTTLDPFRNHTPRIEGMYEWVKIVICLPIALLRLLLFGFALMLGYFSTRIALLGWKHKNNPMPKWRSRLMWVTRICTRCILFSFGYHWIKRRGKPAPREIAPIVVSNHVSYIEPIFFFYELCPTIVASESHDSMPFVGTIIRAMQVIYVDRFSQLSRKQAIHEIKRKASCDLFPRVLLFPEGTTSNGRAIISFELGAFVPQLPIQPVIVRYPFVHFDQSWGHISLARLMFRMFTQFHNFMEVEYLPIVYPLEDQKENAIYFAQRTRHAVASALNVVQTSHSYGDLMLLMKAAESKKENPSMFMAEMGWVKSAFHVSSLQAVGFLDVFLSMNPDSRGHVKIQDFLRVLRLKPCALAEKIFGFIDVQKNGKITFRQFLIASAHVLKHPLFRRACELAFCKCDFNAKGYLLEQELGDSLKLAIPNLSKDEIHQVFSLFDSDCDGRISEEDFISCLHRNPLLIAIFPVSPNSSPKNFS